MDRTEMANRDAELAELDRLAYQLDARFRVPGTNIRIGWDGILTWVPGLGDVATLLPGAYILWRGYHLGARTGTLLRMAGNMGVDFVIGGIPILGDLFDIGFKSNLRNIGLLRRDIERAAQPGSATAKRVAYSTK